ncbi:hypothetical protein [Leptotrichia massiliensis]|uniref:hypothetical protein n=1 Tax=Leptotrichia massiliensis TaxID=1852388 RepID=UPI0008D941E6|nr:hypothetical protein [Leptotrichia massiliensis]
MWKKCSTMEELKELYNIKKIRGELKKEFPNIKIKMNSWENIWLFIKDVNFFLIKERYLFILLNVDNPSRSENLGLSEEIINNKKKLKKWRNEILKYISPDRNNNSEESNKATQKLTEIYKEVLKYEEE